jgi:hypothetical protein
VGEKVPITLNFESAGKRLTIRLHAEVRGRDALAAPGGGP